MELDKISFNEISEVWASNLWKDRQSPIKHISSMVYLGGYDMSIYNNEPTFFSIKESGKIVAVNSGHMTINGYYRSRGLWVKETHRNKGLTYILFNALCNQALSENAEHIWGISLVFSTSTYGISRCGRCRLNGNCRDIFCQRVFGFIGHFSC